MTNAASFHRAACNASTEKQQNKHNLLGRCFNFVFMHTHAQKQTTTIKAFQTACMLIKESCLRVFLPLSAKGQDNPPSDD